MFGLMTNVMLAVTTALAAIGGSFAGNADVAADAVEPPNVDAGGTWDVDVADVGGGSGGVHAGDGSADAYAIAATENARASGEVGATGLDVPALPEL